MTSHAACASLSPATEVVNDSEMAGHIAARLHEVTADEAALSLVFSGGQIAPRVLEVFVRQYLNGRALTVIAADERITMKASDTNAHLLQEAMALGGAAGNVSLVSPAQGVAVDQSAKGFMRQVRSAPAVLAAIVGVGRDGHVASHFPDVPANSLGFVDVVMDAPPPFAQRVTLSMAFLQAIPYRLVALAGTEKVEVLRALAAGRPLPVAQMNPTHAFVSKDAAHMFAAVSATS